MESHMDFPVTRNLIERLPEWVDELASILPEPVRVPVDSYGFRWKYPEQSAEVVQTAKAVRMVSGIRAAITLADMGFTTECGTLLRTVSDCASEIHFLAEGLLAGGLNAAQQKFVDQYFVPFPEDPDELAAREREYYVGRKDILSALRRFGDRFGGGGDDLVKISTFLNKGYDSYVHSSFTSAMELYSGLTKSFMLSGNESVRSQCVAKVSVAGKLYEVIVALELMAITRELEDLRERTREGRKELDGSEEQSSAPCAHL